MSDCCGENKASANHRALCPACGGSAHRVEPETLLYRLRSPWNRRLARGPFYCCCQPGCPIAYFDGAGYSAGVERLREPLAAKAPLDGNRLCFCFDLIYGQVREELRTTGHSDSFEFVKAQTRLGRCACEVRNPSGRCCLKDFPRE